MYRQIKTPQASKIISHLCLLSRGLKPLLPTVPSKQAWSWGVSAWTQLLAQCLKHSWSLHPTLSITLAVT